MHDIDYLIVAENATLGQKIYTTQRKAMLEELGYSVQLVEFKSPDMRITLDMLRIAYIYKKNLEKTLQATRPKIIELYCPATHILQNSKLLRNYKIISSFDLPFGLNITGFGSGLLHTLERRKYRSSDLIFYLTKYGGDFIKSRYRIEKRTVHMPYVLDPAERLNAAISDNDFALAYCPEINLDKKGFDILIRAWNILENDKKLVVLGIREETAALYLRKKDILMPKKVEFVSFLPRAQFISLLASCRFFISSSRSEEFGQIIIEALSFGKTVVSTPTVGPCEFLKEIDERLVSPSFSPADLAGTIEYLAGDSFNNIDQKINHVMKDYEYESVKNRLNEEVVALLTGDNHPC